MIVIGCDSDGSVWRVARSQCHENVFVNVVCDVSHSKEHISLVTKFVFPITPVVGRVGSVRSHAFALAVGSSDGSVWHDRNVTKMCLLT